MEAVRHAVIGTAIGDLTVVASGPTVTGLYFPGHWYRPDRETLGAEMDVREDALLARAAGELTEFLGGGRRGFEVPVAAWGDAFSESVWGLLRAIPYGATTTYGAIAERLGDRTPARRVGRAVGHNPVSIMIPCHRVVGADGSPTGFAGGLERKRVLLEIEERQTTTAMRLF